MYEDIIDLYNKGYSNRKISDSLNISRIRITNIIKNELGLKPNGSSRNIVIDIVDDNSARCRKCGIIKSIDYFPINRKAQRYEYRIAYCQDCRRQQQYDNLNSNPTKFLADRFNRLKRYAKNNGIPFDIDIIYINNLFIKQNGLCFYTDLPMDIKIGDKENRLSLSFDKIVPELGYVKGNVVLCQNRINGMKNDATLSELKMWMPNWYNRILKFNESLIDTERKQT